jgi:hypothetical protein
MVFMKKTILKKVNLHSNIYKNICINKQIQMYAYIFHIYIFFRILRDIRPSNIYIYIRIYIFIYIYIYIYIYIHIHICIYIYIYIYRYTFIYVYTYTHIYIYISIHMYTYKCAYNLPDYKVHRTYKYSIAMYMYKYSSYIYMHMQYVPTYPQVCMQTYNIQFTDPRI